MSRPSDNQPVIRLTPPHCERCGAGTPSVYSLSSEVLNSEVQIWLCASCEYRLVYPEALLNVKDPRSMPPLKLQAETLFDS